MKFFGKTTKTAAKKTAESKEAPAEKPASSTTTTTRASTRTSASKTAVSTNGDAPKTTVRRAARPPRRDWAAEAAATPAGTPVPEPTSLASTPVEDGAAPGAKRRRGTRGGRGRKKAGTTTATADETTATESPARVRDLRTPKATPPATVEEAIALQSATLQRFAADVTSTMTKLQGAIDDLRDRIDDGGAKATSNPRVAIFVDVPNLIYATERRKVVLDFGRVLEHFTRGRELVRASAYAPITDDPQVKLESQRFVQYFVGHPYRLITKPLKRFADGSMKANFDIELAIDILTMSDRLDVVVLMSGDGDFRRVVELVASRGVRVEVAAFSETAASELKAVADLYIDLGQHIDKFRATR